MAMVALEGFGGGSTLNFKVVGGTSKPENSRENTIWANATVTDWVISANQPGNPSDGLLWLQTGITGTEFNALKKGAIQIILKAARVYAAGTWEYIDAHIYKGSAWVQFSREWDGTLYEPGNQYEFITDGWGSSGWTSGVTSYGIAPPVIDDTGINLTNVASQFVVAGTNNLLDLSSVNKIYATIDTALVGATFYLAVNHEKKVGVGTYVMDATTQISGAGEVALDVSSIDSGYVVVFGYGVAGTNIKVTKIRVE